MLDRLQNLWDRARNGFWFLPGLMTLAAVAAGIGLPLVDEVVAERIEQRYEWAKTTPAAAGRTLSAFGGAIVAAAGVVFSITMVTLSLTSQQLGPRLLRTFLADATTQVTLGAFVGAGIYCLLVLRVVREGEEFEVSPHVSVLVATFVSVATLCLLVYFIHHIAVSIQAPNVIRRVAGDLDAAIDRLFPDVVGEDPDGPAEAPASPVDEPAAVPASDDGYVQRIADDTVMRLAKDRDAVIELALRPGDFVVRGMPLALVRPAAAAEGLVGELREAFVLGERRTPRQDVECAITELVEVAVRALSPGINDPFTAQAAVDYLGACLSRFAGRRLPSRYRVDDSGRLRVIAEPRTFESALDAAFDRVRQTCRGHVDVTIRCLEALATIARAAPPDRRGSVRRQADMLRSGAESLPEPNDRAAVDDRYRRLLAVLDGGVGRPADPLRT